MRRKKVTKSFRTAEAKALVSYLLSLDRTPALAEAKPPAACFCRTRASSTAQ
jgi:hypothetical protein